MGSPVPGPGADLAADDLEIVGFNGAPLVECGRALPVVRRKSTDRFFKLSIRSRMSPALECDRQQLEAFSKEGRLTLFLRPLPLPDGLVARPGDAPRQPLVLCVSQGFLDAVGCRRPGQHEGEKLTWQELPGRELVFWVACASEAVAEHVLNSWASQLLLRADDLLAQSEEHWGEALRSADRGLCAAVTPALRWRLYLRYAAAQAWSPEPERPRRTFDHFVRPEFPTCSWEDFTQEFGSLSQTLRARGPRWGARAVGLSPAAAVARGPYTGLAAEQGPARLSEWSEFDDPVLLPLRRDQGVARNGA